MKFSNPNRKNITASDGRAPTVRTLLSLGATKLNSAFQLITCWNQTCINTPVSVFLTGPPREFEQLSLLQILREDVRRVIFSFDFANAYGSVFNLLLDP